MCPVRLHSHQSSLASLIIFCVGGKAGPVLDGLNATLYTRFPPSIAAHTKRLGVKIHPGTRESLCTRQMSNLRGLLNKAISKALAHARAKQKPRTSMAAREPPRQERELNQSLVGWSDAPLALRRNLLSQVAFVTAVGSDAILNTEARPTNVLDAAGLKEVSHTVFIQKTARDNGNVATKKL